MAVFVALADNDIDPEAVRVRVNDLLVVGLLAPVLVSEIVAVELRVWLMVAVGVRVGVVVFVLVGDCGEFVLEPDGVLLMPLAVGELDPLTREPVLL